MDPWLISHSDHASDKSFSNQFLFLEDPSTSHLSLSSPIRRPIYLYRSGIINTMTTLLDMPWSNFCAFVKAKINHKTPNKQNATQMTISFGFRFFFFHFIVFFFSFFLPRQLRCVFGRFCLREVFVYALESNWGIWHSFRSGRKSSQKDSLGYRCHIDIDAIPLTA